MDVTKISTSRAPPHDVNVIVETLATRGAGQEVNVDSWAEADEAAALVAVVIARGPMVETLDRTALAR